MENVNIDHQKAIDILKAHVNNESYPEEFRAAIQVAIESMSNHAHVTKKGKCQYYEHGLCTGQKGMPQCTPNYGYCPKRKDRA